MSRPSWILDVLSRPYYRRRPTQLLRRIARSIVSRRGLQRVQLPWQVEMEVEVDEMVGRSIWETGVFDLAVSECCWRLLDPGELAVDVGANIGYVTGLMAARTGTAGRVLSFEPHPTIVSRLRRNVDLFRTGPVGVIEVHEVGLSSEGGTATLIDGVEFATNQGVARLERESSAQGGIAVRTERLDSWLHEGPIALAKIDVEGHEIDVLRGAEQLLDQGAIRDIVFEDHEGTPSRVRDLLTACGYTVFALGWASRGPLVAAPSAHVARPFESPSYLATRDVERALDRLRPPGWKIFNRIDRLPRWG